MSSNLTNNSEHVSQARASQIAEALNKVRGDLPDYATLIVVTKTFPISDVEILYRLGERHFGENRDEEGASKSLALPDDSIWHFQGNIQSNKVRSIVNWADFIHSLADLRHAQKIDTAARDLEKRQKVFIQVNLDQVNSSDPRHSPAKSHRSGIPPESFLEFANQLLSLRNIEVVGVMGVAPLNRDPSPGFQLLYEKSLILRELEPTASFISAGMSGDYPVALRYGATHIRVGSSILGSR